MSKIFISYSRNSATRAKQIFDDLEGLGHTAWFDDKLTGGQSWWDQILKEIRDCEVFVFVLDPDSLESTACTREYTYAAEVGKPILPILVADDVSTNLLPQILSEIQHFDYREQDRASGFKLVKALADLPQCGPLPEPLPTPPEVPVSYIGGLADQVEKPSLSREEQSLLVVDLKAALREPKNKEDARHLLSKLRKRRDTLAHIGKEIDEALGGSGSSTIKRFVLVGVAAVIVALAAITIPKLLPDKESGTVTEVIPTANISASQSSIEKGETVTLTWTTENATEVSIESLGTVANSGSKEVRPSETKNFTLRARGKEGKEKSANVLVTVTEPPPEPTATLTATQSSVEKGENVTLYWITRNATDASIDGIGTVEITGHRVVQPNETGVFTLRARSKEGKEVSHSVWVTVTEPTPPPELTVIDARIAAEEIAMQWFNFYKAGDVESLVAMANHVPFWTANEVYTEISKLKEKLGIGYEAAVNALKGLQSLTKNLGDELEVKNIGLNTMSIAEYRAQDGPKDGIIRGLSLDDDDIRVEVTFKIGNGDPGSRPLYFRNSNGKLTLVGM